MAPQIVAVNNGGGDYPAKLTKQVVFCSLIAAFGGLMFGIVASKCCQKFGRKPAMQMAAFFFLVGVALNSFAVNINMLIVGRLCLGAGVGFGNQAVPLFISEIAPAKYGGGLNVCFQLLITVGILIANILNFFTSKIHPYGWRISLGGAAVPAIFLGLGSLLIVETPTSLIERGKEEQGLRALQKIRGVEDVHKEYQEIQHAVEMAKKVERPFKNLWRSNKPQLLCGIVLQICQQFTGINVIMFYAPVLFQTMGFGGDASLISAAIAGTINSGATLVAVFGVDKFGRRKLLIQAACQMLITQCMTRAILSTYLKSSNAIPMPWPYIVVVLICLFVMGFAWSWGPLGWLIPSEIFPLETRSAGFCVAVFTNMLCTFIIGQFFLSTLCYMRSGIFFFFAACIVIMGSLAVLFLPETKGVPIDEMNEKVWKKHYFWKHYLPRDDDSSHVTKECA
ncbi:hypothetical protein RD792_010297 [Penstemon davidsonii]|uniref:Major facilitator superfamily (MFS) profile domain-containing protein n=1 Tax=Penstemon davidsonii TaxID=160366 RepID=A0ABR0D2W0_9LAMI|nr:hypothetical protein RD792_010297 [Penstemon davidsonii]